MNQLKKNFSFFYFLPFLAFLIFTSCSHKESFQKSVVVPAANGEVKIKKDNNSNYKLSVSVKDLTKPENLVPSKSSYVVWIETEGNGTQNLGQLSSSRNFLGGRFKASLDAVSSYKPRRIFITAEDDGKIQYPGNQVVLTTSDF